MNISEKAVYAILVPVLLAAFYGAWSFFQSETTGTAVQAVKFEKLEEKVESLENRVHGLDDKLFQELSGIRQELGRIAGHLESQ